MSIREYSMTRDSTRQLSPSFRVREFACKGSDVVFLIVNNDVIAGTSLLAAR